MEDRFCVVSIRVCVSLSWSLCGCLMCVYVGSLCNCLMCVYVGSLCRCIHVCVYVGSLCRCLTCVWGVCVGASSVCVCGESV